MSDAHRLYIDARRYVIESESVTQQRDIAAIFNAEAKRAGFAERLARQIEKGFR